MKPEEFQFYQNLYPVLKMEGWEETGEGGSAFATWYLPMQSRFNARVNLYVWPTNKLALRVQHPIHGFHQVDLGSATISPYELRSRLAIELPKAEQIVEEMCQEWEGDS